MPVNLNPGAAAFAMPQSRAGAWTNSRTWRSPEVVEKEAWDRKYKALKRAYPKTNIFDEGFDLKAHQAAIAAEEKERQEVAATYEANVIANRKRLDLPPPAPLKPAFGGKTFSTNYSNTLSWQTVFCPQYQSGREDVVAPWPAPAEMKYEGEERISTVALHRRFLGIPRVPGNETVNWQHLSAVPQYPLDNNYVILSSDDIFFRNHYIEQLEPSDEEGKEVLGTDIMEMLRSTRATWV